MLILSNCNRKQNDKPCGKSEFKATSQAHNTRLHRIRAGVSGGLPVPQLYVGVSHISFNQLIICLFNNLYEKRLKQIEGRIPFTKVKGILPSLFYNLFKSSFRFFNCFFHHFKASSTSAHSLSYCFKRINNLIQIFFK